MIDQPISCFLAQFSDKPCDGRLIRAHLIPKQLIKRELGEDHVWSPLVWVWACGGPMGNAGHHGMLDSSRTLRIPRDKLPEGVEAFAERHGLAWFLEREYGPTVEQQIDVLSRAALAPMDDEAA